MTFKLLYEIILLFFLNKNKVIKYMYIYIYISYIFYLKIHYNIDDVKSEEKNLNIIN